MPYRRRTREQAARVVVRRRGPDFELVSYTPLGMAYLPRFYDFPDDPNLRLITFMYEVRTGLQVLWRATVRDPTGVYGEGPATDGSAAGTMRRVLTDRNEPASFTLLVPDHPRASLYVMSPDVNEVYFPDDDPLRPSNEMILR